MNTAPSSAATKARAWKWLAPSASDVPTSTGATAAGRVRRRAAITQMRTAPTLSPLGKAGEVRRALLAVGVASLLCLLACVKEEVGVMRELLDAAQAVLGGVEAGLQQPQREGRHREHLATPADCLLLERRERHDRVDEAHLERLLGAVLAAEEPDLLGLLGPAEIGEEPRADAAGERAHPGPHLPEAGGVGGDRQAARAMQ